MHSQNSVQRWKVWGSLLLSNTSTTTRSESVYVEYRRRGKWIRIIWDGKESVLLAHVSPAQENVWTDVETTPGSSPKPVDRDLDDERIERLRDAIERIAEGAG